MTREECLRARDDAKAMLTLAEHAVREAEKNLLAAEVRENEEAYVAGKHPPYYGDYSNGTGRYEKAWRALEEALVPTSGKADTQAGNVLRGFMKLFYQCNNNGIEPRVFYDDNTDYFHGMDTSAADFALDDAPTKDDGDRSLFDTAAQARWIEAFLDDFFEQYCDDIEKLLPLPGVVHLRHTWLTSDDDEREKKRPRKD